MSGKGMGGKSPAPIPVVVMQRGDTLSVNDDGVYEISMKRINTQTQQEEQQVVMTTEDVDQDFILGESWTHIDTEMNKWFVAFVQYSTERNKPHYFYSDHETKNEAGAFANKMIAWCEFDTDFGTEGGDTRRYVVVLMRAAQDEEGDEHGMVVVEGREIKNGAVMPNDPPLHAFPKVSTRRALRPKHPAVPKPTPADSVPVRKKLRPRK